MLKDAADNNRNASQVAMHNSLVVVDERLAGMELAL